jgi:hypothetical protein
MDSFIKIVEQKKVEPVTTIHTKQIELLKKYLAECKNVFICGSSGVGKTYILQSVLNESNSIEIQKEHLKSKSPFLTFIKGAAKHTFIEDYDSDFKSIIETVSDGKKVSRGSMVVTSTAMCMFPNFETIFVPKHKPEILLKLVEDQSSKNENAAIRSDGNIRTFFSYIEGYNEIDSFKTPKEFIADILSDPAPIPIYDKIHEHGHVWDIFQENYLDSKGVDMKRCMSAFSEADLYDTCMYNGVSDWNVMPYFVLNALVIPKFYLGDPLDKDKIRPGSCWTKYGNYKMRFHKYNEIKQKLRVGLDNERLSLIKIYAQNGDIQKMLDYGLTPQDFDVMNHLAVGNKLKQRDVTRVKKALKNAIAERNREDL